jgi:hypothetical protein
MKIVPVACIALALSGVLFAFQEKQAVAPAPAVSAKPDAEVIAKQLPSYPLTECPVSHEGLDAMGKPLDLVHEGRLVRLCCKGCVKEFKKDPTVTLKAIDAGVIAAQQASYPLKTCIVSGEELASMEAPLDMVHGTRLVRLCCKGCVKGFQKNPDEQMAKIDAALIAEQKKSYALATCLVCDKDLGAGDDSLYGTRLVRTCCAGCTESFHKEPTKHVAKLDKAAPKKN